MTKRIVIEAAAREEFKISLVGKEYTLTPPKTMFSLRVSTKIGDAGEDVQKMLGVLEEWLTAAMGTKQAKAIFARLESASDDLDFDHLIDLFTKVMGESTENPTT